MLAWTSLTGNPALEPTVFYTPEHMAELGLSPRLNDITPEAAPDGLTVLQAHSVKGFEDFFFDVTLVGDADDVQFDDVMNISGFVVVSASMRDAIMKCDPEGEHEFVRCQFLGEGFEALSIEQEYFHFWCRRRVFLKAGTPDYEYRTSYRTHSIARLFGSLKQAKMLSLLPIWMRRTQTNEFFMSDTFFRSLSDFELSGMAEFSEPGGAYSKDSDGSSIDRLENVGRVYLPTKDCFSCTRTVATSAKQRSNNSTPNLPDQAQTTRIAVHRPLVLRAASWGFSKNTSTATAKNSSCAIAIGIQHGAVDPDNYSPSTHARSRYQCDRTW